MFARVLILLGITAAAATLWAGLDYYLLPLAERPFSPLHELYAPSGLIGHGLGILGTLMILAGVLLYSTRKRVSALARMGKLKHWLEFHIFLCLLGPYFVLLHTTFKVGGLVAISFWSMVLVVASGAFGRWVYVWIPKTLNGQFLGVQELKQELAWGPTTRARHGPPPRDRQERQRRDDRTDRRRPLGFGRRPVSRGGRGPNPAIRHVGTLDRRQRQRAARGRGAVPVRPSPASVGVDFDLGCAGIERACGADVCSGDLRALLDRCRPVPRSPAVPQCGDPRSIRAVPDAVGVRAPRQAVGRQLRREPNRHRRLAELLAVRAPSRWAVELRVRARRPTVVAGWPASSCSETP